MNRGDSLRAQLSRKAARLSETECAEVLAYIAVLRTLQRAAQRPKVAAETRFDLVSRTRTDN